MSFERWIIELLPFGVIHEPWFPHLALFVFLIAIQMMPIVMIALFRLLVAFAQLFFAALLAILPAAAIGLGRALSILLSVAGRGALLVWFIALEAGRSDAQDEGDNPFGPEATTGAVGIAEACAQLGLPERGFTQSDLKRAYHRAIKRAYPDQGGSAADTMAILNARDRISEHFGWS
jgi:hypothetical protein